MNWNPPCLLCGHIVAEGCSAGSLPFRHATCAVRDAEMPKYRFRVTWRGKMILQERRNSFNYRDCRINQNQAAMAIQLP